MKNMNEFQPDNDGNFPDQFKDNSVRCAEANISVLFRNHKKILIEKIKGYNCVVGCVAWLTDYDVLRALSDIDQVSIVVQKEDFLRPDIDSNSNWRLELRRHYDALKNSSARFAWPGLMGKLSVCYDPTIHPIRCVGNHNAEKKPAFPRMHNKFLVFCEYSDGKANEGYEVNIEPKEVWTGSFNLTKNATMSLENALLISDSKIAKAFYDEFCQIFALSESLDWENQWCAPEFRIGT